MEIQCCELVPQDDVPVGLRTLCSGKYWSNKRSQWENANDDPLPVEEVRAIEQWLKDHHLWEAAQAVGVTECEVPLSERVTVRRVGDQIHLRTDGSLFTYCVDRVGCHGKLFLDYIVSDPEGFAAKVREAREGK